MVNVSIQAMVNIWVTVQSYRNLNLISASRINRDKSWLNNVSFTVHIFVNTVTSLREKIYVVSYQGFSITHYQTLCFISSLEKNLEKRKKSHFK